MFSELFKFLGVLAILAVIATLPFHYVYQDPYNIEYLPKIFPKNQLSFKNTFISQSDVDNLIDRYNNASFQEKSFIKSESLFITLQDEGIIYRKEGE